MASSRRIEVEFEYAPTERGAESIAARENGDAVGVLLELAVHAVNAALPGYGLENLRFGPALRLNGPRRCLASVDPASRRVEVSSFVPGAPATQPVTHLVGDAGRFDEMLWQQRLLAVDPESRPFLGIEGAEFAREVVRSLPAIGSVPDCIRNVQLYDDGAAAQVALADDSSRSYRIHPAVVDCGWILAAFWAMRRGLSDAVIPRSAEAFHVVHPGARIDRIRLVQLGSSPGQESLLLVAEREREMAAFLYALTISDAEAVGGHASGANRVDARGELARELTRRHAAERRAFCIEYVSKVVVAALDRATSRVELDDLPIDVPFRDLGLTSAQATAVAATLAVALARPISATLLFDQPTVEKLVDALLLKSEVEARARRARRSQAAGVVREAIAVIGIGCRFPGGANTPEDYWRLLREGADAVGPIPIERRQLISGLERVPYALGAIQDVDLFDARFFGLSDLESNAMDPQQRILLEVTWQALEDAGIVPSSLADSRTGVFIGISTQEYSALIREMDAYSVLGNAPSVAAGRLSYFFGLRGPNMCVDSACSSSLVSVCLACESLQRYESDLGIAGGINLCLDPKATVGLAAAGVLSASGHSRAFDDAADGYVRGEGSGIVILRRLADALQAGDRIIAVLRGHAVAHGGRGNGLAAPNSAAQSDLMRQALKSAGLPASAVAYVEAHGTGTAIGDAVELQSLAETYGVGSQRGDSVRVGSVKTNIGHLESAAGVAGLIKTALAIRHAEIPRNLHFETPLRTFDWARGGLSVPTALEPFPPHLGQRYAAVNSFGMGGTYAHVVVESWQADGSAQRTAAAGPALVPVSGRSERSVRALATAYAESLERGCSAQDLARTAGQHRQHMDLRAAAVGDGAEELAAKLRAIGQGEIPLTQTRGAPPRIAFLFTGQGSQYVGMGRGLYAREAAFRAAFDECEELCGNALERPLRSFVYSNDADEAALRRTAVAQPALFAVEYALARLWRSWGVEPTHLLGHSIGELVAAHLAGVFSLADAIDLVLVRGALMESLCTEGGMAALSASLSEAAEVMRSYDGQLSIAAVNAPRQVVVSGPVPLIARLCADSALQTLRPQRLPVSRAFHSMMMDAMLDPFEEKLRAIELSPPLHKLVSNVTGMLAGEEVCTPEYWRNHTRAPVMFQAGVETLCAEGANVFVEIGPQPVLLGLAATSVGDKTFRWLPSLRKGEDDLLCILRSVAELYSTGVDLEWTTLPGSREGRLQSIPTYRFDRRRYWQSPGVVERGGQSSNRRAWHYEVRWLRSPSRPREVERGRWLVLDSGTELGPRLKAALERHGAAASAASSLSDLRSRLTTFEDARGVIWLADACQDLEQLDSQQLLEIVVGQCARLAQVVRILAEVDRPVPLWIVTRGAQQVADEDEDVVHASLWGLGRAIGLEHPALWGGMVDLCSSSHPDEADALCDALLCDDGETQAALRSGQRFVPRVQMVQNEPGRPPTLDPEAEYVIVGGLGHIGVHLAGFLVRAGARQIVLASRRRIDRQSTNGMERDRVKRLHQLEILRGLGATLRIEEVDVGDSARVQDLLRGSRIGGVFHAAGVDDYLPIVEMDDEKLRVALSSKVAGAWELHKLTLRRSIRHFVLNSSLAAIASGVGHGAYAAANAFLDALARHRRWLGAPGVSVGWGLWGGDGGMGTGEGVKYVTRVGIRAMEPESALEELGAVLQSNPSQRIVADVAWQQLRSVYEVFGSHPMFSEVGMERTDQHAGAAPASSSAALVKRLSALSERERIEQLSTYLRQELKQVIGGDYDEASLERDFRELGIDSLAAVQLRSRIFGLVGVTVSIFEHPNLGLLAAALARSLDSGGAQLPGIERAR